MQAEVIPSLRSVMVTIVDSNTINLWNTEPVDVMEKEDEKKFKSKLVGDVAP